MARKTTVEHPDGVLRDLPVILPQLLLRAAGPVKKGTKRYFESYNLSEFKMAAATNSQLEETAGD